MGVTVDGRDRVTNNNPNNFIYTVAANMDSNIGTSGQTTGLLYNTTNISGTTVSFIGEGMNELNTSINPIYRNDKNFGLIWPTEVYSDIFIERSKYNVSERHLRLAEINTTDDLRTYYNSYYKILTNGK